MNWILCNIEMSSHLYKAYNAYKLIREQWKSASRVTSSEYESSSTIDINGSEAAAKASKLTSLRTSFIIVRVACCILDFRFGFTLYMRGLSENVLLYRILIIIVLLYVILTQCMLYFTSVVPDTLLNESMMLSWINSCDCCKSYISCSYSIAVSQHYNYINGK